MILVQERRGIYEGLKDLVPEPFMEHEELSGFVSVEVLKPVVT